MSDRGEIGKRIDAALLGRRSRRSQVVALCDSIDDLERRFADLADAVDRIVGATVDGDIAAASREGIRQLFFDGEFGRGYVRAVSADLAELRRRAEVIRRRVERETVNLGVVGMTKAGKSTLLRAVTGLDTSVIPSSKDLPTTAALSRIVHGSGAPEAVLRLHTWESFRDGYLQPLHDSAKLGNAPRTVEEFAARRYPAPESLTDAEIDTQSYLWKVHEAQESLPSYRDLLTHRGEMTVLIRELLPYVAYPTTADAHRNRPYHAVREVVITTKFPEINDARIGLVDLPGAGEAGLDVARHFVARLHNDVDLMLMVKFPDDNSSFMTTDDHKVVNLAEGARSGVALADFFAVVLNRKHHPQDRDAADRDRQQDEAYAGLRKALEHRNIRIFRVNAQDPAQVRAELVLPLLDHLAADLAAMDHAAMGAVLAFAREVAGRIERYAAALTERARDAGRLLDTERFQIVEAVDELRIDLGNDLLALVQRYEAEVQRGEPDPVMRAAIADGVRQVKEWLPGWLANEAARGKEVDPLSNPERDYRTARHRISEAFHPVGASLRLSTAPLYRDIAARLRTHLSEHLVGDPDTPDTLANLERVAADNGAPKLAAALAELRTLDTGYGNVVLRVGRPIIRGIGFDAESPEEDDARSEAESREELARRMFTPDAAPAAPVAGRSAPRARTIPGDATQLREQLRASIEYALTTLEKRLTEEARGLRSVLYHAADLFVDKVIRTNRIEAEYRELCTPHRVAIWPELFGGGAVRLEETLARIRDDAEALRRDAIRLTTEAAL
ncbi:dynamin family protein [Nocardia bovistercoris]|uniref:Dynamin family protein n=1 Tax=Nocardia bovistercoris TaxID=2785916 RepID=A0A931IAC6_9NOCA|nr:dynamin family protein [Nocardia bovistercoris]MBH0776582.1 dynamin family protein [Nocardia bovistercoris]